jgi:hypothetical protein
MRNTYPYYSLRKAVEKLKLFHEVFGYNSATAEQFCVSTGYTSSFNGAASSLFSTTKKYGLIIFDEKTRVIKISDLGREVLKGNLEATEKAAFLPPLFKSLWNLRRTDLAPQTISSIEQKLFSNGLSSFTKFQAKNAASSYIGTIKYLGDLTIFR